MKHDSLYQGKTALITGASGGVGEAFARALANRGCRLILTGHGGSELARVAESLPRVSRVDAPLLVDADITAPEGLATLDAAIAASGRPVDLLIHAAGFLTYGHWRTLDIERELAMVRLHIDATMRLTRRHLPGMIERRRGGIITVASLSAFMPTPQVATYGATKAFLLSWSESLWMELQGTGVRALAFCPGPLQTSLFAGAGMAITAQRRTDIPVDRAVAAALNAFERNKSFVVPGFRARLFSLTPRFLPRSIMVKESGVMIRRWLAPKGNRP